MPLPPRVRRTLQPRRCARLALIVVAILALAACASAPSVKPIDRSAAGTFTAPVTELQFIDTGAGAGAEALPGMFVVLHYTGWIFDPAVPRYHGTKFDSSVDRNAAFGFYLDTGRVIKGWDDGVAGMKIGGTRTLVVPARMAYGASGTSAIPPNATLIFDIELIDVRHSRGGGDQ